MNSENRYSGMLVLIMVGLLLASCRQSASNNGRTIPPVDIRIEVVSPETFQDVIQVAGTVKAVEDVNLSPEEGGVVKEWKVKKGQTVRKGDLVVILKDDMLKAGWNAAQAQYQMAELNLEKQKNVYEEKGISELQYKTLQYTRDAAKANADLMKARWEHTQLRSPIDGVVDNTVPNEGDFAPPGMALARIVNTSSMKIQAEVPEMYAGSFALGVPASFTFDALPGDTLHGNASFVGSTVSAVNRTLQVEFVVRNTDRKLKPELVAKVRLVRRTRTNAVLVSENLVQLVDRDRMIVYVENGGKAEERRLKLGARQGIKLEVLEGLNVGDRLIVSGQQKLIDGSPVIVIE